MKSYFEKKWPSHLRVNDSQKSRTSSQGPRSTPHEPTWRWLRRWGGSPADRGPAEWHPWWGSSWPFYLRLGSAFVKKAPRGSPEGIGTERENQGFTHMKTTWHENASHDDVIKWKHFPRYWPFVRGIHRSPVNSPHKGQWRGALMFSLICARINGWVNNGEAGDLRRNRAHYDVAAMSSAYLAGSP